MRSGPINDQIAAIQGRLKEHPKHSPNTTNDEHNLATLVGERTRRLENVRRTIRPKLDVLQQRLQDLYEKLPAVHGRTVIEDVGINIYEDLASSGQLTIYAMTRPHDHRRGTPPSPVVIGFYDADGTFREDPDLLAATVNPQGGTGASKRSAPDNCGSIIEAVVSSLVGRPFTTAPATGATGADAWEERHRIKLGYGKSIKGAFAAVAEAGDGAIAVVGFKTTDGVNHLRGAHVVVMTNVRGQPCLIEGQAWSEIDPKEVIRDPARANARYNSNGKTDVGYTFLNPTN